MTDVDEVVGTETEEDSQVQMPEVEPPNRFDKIKESYKGVTSALDLSEETAAYEDFQSLLTDHKVRKEAFAWWTRGWLGAYCNMCTFAHTHTNTSWSCGTTPLPHIMSSIFVRSEVACFKQAHISFSVAGIFSSLRFFLRHVSLIC